MKKAQLVTAHDLDVHGIPSTIHIPFVGFQTKVELCCEAPHAHRDYRREGQIFAYYLWHNIEGDFWDGFIDALRLLRGDYQWEGGASTTAKKESSKMDRGQYQPHLGGHRRAVPKV